MTRWRTTKPQMQHRIRIFNICGHRIKVYLKKDPTISDDLIKNYFIIQNEFYKQIKLDTTDIYLNVYIEQKSKWIKLWNNRKFSKKKDVCIYEYHLKELFYDLKDFESKEKNANSDSAYSIQFKENYSLPTSTSSPLIIDNFDAGFAK